MRSLEFPSTPSGFTNTKIVLRSVYFISNKSINTFSSLNPDDLNAFYYNYILNILPSIRSLNLIESDSVNTSSLFKNSSDILNTYTIAQYFLYVYLLHISNESKGKDITNNNALLNLSLSEYANTTYLEIKKSIKYNNMNSKYLTKYLDSLNALSLDTNVLIDLESDSEITILWG